MDDNSKIRLENYFSKYKQIKSKKGYVLLGSQEKSDSVYYLKEGLVKMYSLSPEGEEIVLNIFKAGSMFPLSCALNGTVNPYLYESVSSCVLYKAPSQETIDLLKYDNQILLSLMKRIYTGLDGYFMRMEYLIGGSAMSRLIVELVISARRFGNKRSKGLEINVKQTELAASCGIARETISRLLKSLKSKGILKITRGKILVTDLLKLESELGN